METTEQSRRGYFGIMSALPWALGTILWGLMGNYIRDWRYLNFTAGLYGLVFLPCIWSVACNSDVVNIHASFFKWNPLDDFEEIIHNCMYCRVFPESPRWLMVNGRFEEALEVLKKGAKFNGTTLRSDEEILRVMEAIAKVRFYIENW